MEKWSFRCSRCDKKISSPKKFGFIDNEIVCHKCYDKHLFLNLFLPWIIILVISATIMFYIIKEVYL